MASPPHLLAIDVTASRQQLRCVVVFHWPVAVPSDQTVTVRLHPLWQANLDGVAAIVAVAHLRQKLNRCSRSSNVHIRKEYNRFRACVDELLRDIGVPRSDGIGAVTVLSLDSIRVAVRDNDRFCYRVVDALIMAAVISTQKATSLINETR